MRKVHRGKNPHMVPLAESCRAVFLRPFTERFAKAAIEKGDAEDMQAAGFQQAVQMGNHRPVVAGDVFEDVVVQDDIEGGGGKAFEILAEIDPADGERELAGIEIAAKIVLPEAAAQDRRKAFLRGKMQDAPVAGQQAPAAQHLEDQAMALQ